jgi:hypothetical protein
VVAEVAHGRDAGRELLSQRGVDHVLELVRREPGDPVQRRGAVVAAQVDVRIDQPGEQRRVVGHLATVRSRERGGFHAHDHAVVHEDEGAVGEGPLAVERDVRPVSAHGRTLAARRRAQPKLDSRSQRSSQASSPSTSTVPSAGDRRP